eukprot:TRINITY_DN3570_c0_g1_i2.p1 TRINITY_DN3570_c0_g1~~TRINITY_DN3570_c0_g1_i2.p1  ORF type:complete len:1202 (-),score=242.44 TRINITY_DN3570_c0_g1_i2:216-3821(-)
MSKRMRLYESLQAHNLHLQLVSEEFARANDDEDGNIFATETIFALLNSVNRFTAATEKTLPASDSRDQWLSSLNTIAHILDDAHYQQQQEHSADLTMLALRLRTAATKFSASLEAGISYFQKRPSHSQNNSPRSSRSRKRFGAGSREVSPKRQSRLARSHSTPPVPSLLENRDVIPKSALRAVHYHLREVLNSGNRNIHPDYVKIVEDWIDSESMFVPEQLDLFATPFQIDIVLNGKSPEKFSGKGSRRTPKKKGFDQKFDTHSHSHKKRVSGTSKKRLSLSGFRSRHHIGSPTSTEEIHNLHAERIHSSELLLQSSSLNSRAKLVLPLVPQVQEFIKVINTMILNVIPVIEHAARARSRDSTESETDSGLSDTHSFVENSEVAEQSHERDRGFSTSEDFEVEGERGEARSSEKEDPHLTATFLGIQMSPHEVADFTVKELNKQAKEKVNTKTKEDQEKSTHRERGREMEARKGRVSGHFSSSPGKDRVVPRLELRSLASLPELEDLLSEGEDDTMGSRGDRSKRDSLRDFLYSIPSGRSEGSARRSGLNSGEEDEDEREAEKRDNFRRKMAEGAGRRMSSSHSPRSHYSRTAYFLRRSLSPRSQLAESSDGTDSVDGMSVGDLDLPPVAEGDAHVEDGKLRDFRPDIYKVLRKVTAKILDLVAKVLEEEEDESETAEDPPPSNSLPILSLEALRKKCAPLKGRVLPVSPQRISFGFSGLDAKQVMLSNIQGHTEVLRETLTMLFSALAALSTNCRKWILPFFVEGFVDRAQELLDDIETFYEVLVPSPTCGPPREYEDLGTSSEILSAEGDPFAPGSLSNVVARAFSLDEVAAPFFDTYLEYTTPATVFCSLKGHWESIVRFGSSPELTFINELLESWVSQDLVYFDFELREQMLGFVREKVSTLAPNVAIRILKAVANFPKKYEMQTPNPFLCYMRVPVYKLPFTEYTAFLDLYRAPDLVEQFTLLDWRLYQKVTKGAILNQAWEKDRFRIFSRELVTIIRRIDSLAHWTATTIMLQKLKDERANALSSLILLAFELLDRRNYLSFMGIMTGLNMVAVTRLTHTFRKLSEKVQKRLKTCSEAADPAHSFGKLRALHERHAQSFLVPYVGTVLGDITLIGENMDFVQEDGKKLINFDKHQLMSKSVHSYLRWQSFKLPSGIVEKNPLYHLLCTLAHLTEDQLYNMSLELEPRGSLVRDIL